MAIRIQDYPNYLVYEDGRIWSEKTQKFLKPSCNKKGYSSVELFNEKGSKRLLIHRLVALAFIPNPDNLPQINHKDENPRNNHIDNLEWCTAKYNMNYGEGAKTRHLNIDYSKPIFKENAIKNGKRRSKPVLMFTKKGDFIARFESAVEASKQTGIDKTDISRSARTNKYNAGGYAWRFENEKGGMTY